MPLKNYEAETGIPRDQLLKALGLVDTAPEQPFDKLTKLASEVLSVPIALISIIDWDKDRQVFKSQIGLNEPWASASQTPLSHSICQHVVGRNAPLIIDNARLDDLVCGNLAVRDLNVVAYLGTPVFLPNGEPVGALCIIEEKPRSWTDDELKLLNSIADCVSDQIALRIELKTSEFLRQQQKQLNQLYRHAPAMMHSIDPQGRIIQVSDHWLTMLGYAREEVMGRKSVDFLTPQSARIAIETEIPNLLKTGHCQNIELQMVSKDGRIIDVLLSATTHCDSAGEHRLSFAVVTDVSDWRRLERESRLINERYRSIVETQDELICRFDRDLVLTFVNGAYQDYIKRDDLIGLSFLELIPETAHEAIRQRIAQLRPSMPDTYEHEVKRADGTIGWQQWTDIAIADENGEIVEYQSVGRDITDRKRLEVHTQRLATSDYLTDLPNRRAFDSELRTRFARAKKKKHAVALIYVDLDYFKSVNDTHGHDMGDSLLVEVSRRMRGAVRQIDFVARIGGDEFAIIAECPDDESSISSIVERTINAVMQVMNTENEPIFPSVSIGLAQFPEDCRDLATLRSHADAALYAAKSAGRGTWRRYQNGMPKGTNARIRADAPPEMSLAQA